MERQGKDIQEITLAIEEQKAIVPEKTFEEVVFAPGGETDGYISVDYSDQSETAEDLELTEDDITYLRLK